MELQDIFDKMISGLAALSPGRIEPPAGAL